jgi:hypothetical protein
MAMSERSRRQNPAAMMKVKPDEELSGAGGQGLAVSRTDQLVEEIAKKIGYARNHGTGK